MVLEAIFQAFDEIAKMRGIFKVEAFGNCYVAPEPCPNHAIVMSWFARDCLKWCEDYN